MFADIKNFIEDLVSARIQESLVLQGVQDTDFLEDVACVALNRLPPRYIRFTVDLMVNLSLEERERLEREVTEAVADAVEIVSNRRSQREID